MLNDLREFQEKINILSKDYSMYFDGKKGILIPINTPMLLVKVEYLELDEIQYQKMLFEKRVEDLDYKTTKATRRRTKNTVTGKEEDSDTIIDVEEDVKMIWNVSNGLGIYKSFTDKEEALKLSDEINKKYFDILLK